MSGLLLLQHGTAKYLNFPELIGGALLVNGLFTRPVAFVLSGMCAVAYFYAHVPRGFFPLLNGGELAALYCFVFLYLAAAGGGAWSANKLWRSSSPQQSRGEGVLLSTARSRASAPSR